MTYVYCEWADVQPSIAVDKGTRSFSRSVLELESHAEGTWATGLERKFEKDAGEDPVFTLLILAKQRKELVSRAAAKG